MAKKKTSSKRASSADTKSTTMAALASAPAAGAKKPASKKAAAKKPTAKKASRSSSADSGGLFVPNGTDDQTAAEKSLASAVLAAGGTDKLLSILKHVEAAGGTSSAVGALEVYERMRRVLNPTNNEDAVAHPLFDSMDATSGDDDSAKE